MTFRSRPPKTPLIKKKNNDMVIFELVKHIRSLVDGVRFVVVNRSRNPGV
jgi:hypothetical protein